MPRGKRTSTVDPQPDPPVAEESEGAQGAEPGGIAAERAEAEREAPSDAPADVDFERHEDLPIFGYRVKVKVPGGGLSTLRRPVKGGRVKIEILASVERREIYEPETGGWYLVFEASHISHRIHVLPTRGLVNGELFDEPAEATIVDAEGILAEHVATCEHCYTGGSLNSVAGKCGDYMELLATYRVEHPEEFGDDVTEGGEAPSETGVVDLTTEEEEPAHA